MRKRRRLADKLTIMVCAVLVAVSAFFYAPMDVSAEEFSGDAVFIDNLGSVVPLSSLGSEYNGNTIEGYYRSYNFYDLESFDFSNYMNSGAGLYKISFDIVCNMTVSNPAYFYNSSSQLVFAGTSSSSSVLKTSSSRVSELSFSGSRVMYTTLGDTTMDVRYSGICVWTKANGNPQNVTITGSYSLSNIVVEKVESGDADSYQNGYDAGYSAGEQAGYGNGYSQGFTDGEASVDTDAIYDEAFQAGKDSVDTQSYYEAGYRAGYQIAYSKGYDSGYEKGLESARQSKGDWGVQKKLSGDGDKIYGLPFYVSSYGLVERELYEGTDSTYFYNTVPGTYKGETEILYKMPISSMNAPYGALVSDSGCTKVNFVLPSFKIDWDVNVAGATLKSNISNGYLFEVYVTYGGKKYYGVVGSSYVSFDFIIDEPIEELLFSDSNFQITFVVENSVVLVTDSDVTLYVGAEFTPYVSFNDFNFFVTPYYKNDNVSANIQNQTDKLTGGWNGSSGSSANSDLTFGLNEFETAENSLFATATTGMKDFTFFDIESVPAMLTAVTFITSIMGSWFEQAGGASGVGIVLSILFSVMLVSMVLGLYRLYQSAGHRAEARQRHAENMERWKKGK